MPSGTTFLADPVAAHDCDPAQPHGTAGANDCPPP